MLDAERQRTFLIQRSLIDRIERSLEQLESLQSLELQQLRLTIERRRIRGGVQAPASVVKFEAGDLRGADMVIRPRRAA